MNVVDETIWRWCGAIAVYLVAAVVLVLRDPD